MRVLSLLLAAAFLAGMLALAGCGNGKETPEKPGAESGEKQGNKDGKAGTGKAGAEGTGKGEEGNGEKGGGEENGEKEGDGEGDNAEAPKELKSDEERIWPDHPLAKKVLTDPYDESKSSSYWINAKVGDWVRFLNWQKNIIIYTVLTREGNKLSISVKQYKRDGEEIPETSGEEDVRKIDIEADSRLNRNSALQNPHVERYVYEWPLYKTDKTFYCERRWVPNPMTGENNDTCRSWEVRCGGLIYQRRGNTTYVTLIDYGDVEHPPKWEHLDPDDMFKYWYKYDRFLHQKPVSQEDPGRGEEPEMPEDCPPAKLVEKLEHLDKLVGRDLRKTLSDGKYDEAIKSLEQVGAPVEEAVSYARTNNFKPAIEQAQAVNEKTGELIEVCKEKDFKKAIGALEVLREEIDWLNASVGRQKSRD